MKVCTAPIKPIKLEFADDTSAELLYNAYAMFILDTEFEGLINVLNNAPKFPYKEAHKIIYAGLKGAEFMKESKGQKIEKEYTLKDSKVIMCNLHLTDILDIIELSQKTLEMNEKYKKKAGLIPQDHKKKSK